METRKIQQVGGGTYTVSLPKEWATAADIESGASVALHTHIDGTLVIQAGVETCEGTTLSVSVETADPTCLERTLRAAYAAGIDAVELTADDGFTARHHRTVEGITRNLTGVTITEATDQTIRVRSLLDPGEVSITQSVRQLQFAALSAHRDATAAVTGATTVENPAGRDDQADRIFAMVDRYFQRGLDSLSVMDALGLTRPELFVRWSTARELERVADHAQQIATVANRMQAPIEGEFADEFEALADRTRTLVRDAVAGIVDGDDAAIARRLLDQRDQLRADLRALDRTLFERDGAPYRLTTALDALDRTADAAGHIAELALRTRLRAQLRSETPLAIGDGGAPSAADAEP